VREDEFSSCMLPGWASDLLRIFTAIAVHRKEIKLRTLSLILLIPAVLACKGPDYSVNGYYGVRSLTSDLDNFDNHAVYGADVVLALKAKWLAVEAGFLHSDEDTTSGVTTQLDLNEYFAGIRFLPWKLVVEPYASAGISLVNGDFGVADDTKAAAYIRLGAAYPITSLFKIGIDGRALLGSDFDTGALTDESADYFQLMFFVGAGI